MVSLCTIPTDEIIFDKIRNIITKDSKKNHQINDDSFWLSSYDILRIIDELFWLLPLKPTTKGTTYYKHAVYLAYFDNRLLFDNKRLVEKIAEIHSTDSKNVRGLLDSTTNSLHKPNAQKILSNFFQNDYDYSDLTVKCFIAILVNKLNILTGKEPINMFNFI